MHTKLWRGNIKFERYRPKIERYRPKIGRNYPKIGRNYPKIERNRPKTGVIERSAYHSSYELLQPHAPDINKVTSINESILMLTKGIVRKEWFQ
jgi:hypothetical protein